jgi:hypothetical protein
MTVFIHVIFALLANFLAKNTEAAIAKNRGVKIMRGIFGSRHFNCDFQVRSGIRYPIHKREMKHFRVII